MVLSIFCILAGEYKCIKYIQCLLLQGKVCCSETLLTTYQSTRSHNLEPNLQHHRHKNLQMFHMLPAGVELYGEQS
jgi:hypothetical protein